MSRVSLYSPRFRRVILQHTTGEASVRLEWSNRVGSSVSVVPATTLYHQRPGWKIAVDLHPAPTAAAASTTVWPADKKEEQIEGEVLSGAGRDAWLKVATAGEMLEVIVEARDAHGNHRSVGKFVCLRES